MIIGAAKAEWQAEELGWRWWGGAVGFKKSKLAVNNRCNFGTFQICSSGNQKIKRTQTAPVPTPSTLPVQLWPPLLTTLPWPWCVCVGVC